MSWAPILIIAALAFIVGAWALKIPRQAWALFGLALIVGLAGYGWQGSPGYAGAPKANSSALAADGAPLVEARRAMLSAERPPSRLVIVADSYTRQGKYESAASLLGGAVSENPKDGEAWLALANVLTEHADGALTPAALYAFGEARKYLPGSPAPDYFLGVAMIRAGQLGNAEQLWSSALEAAPADAPWRDDLALRLTRLRELMAQMQQMQTQGAPSPQQPLAPGQ